MRNIQTPAENRSLSIFNSLTPFAKKKALIFWDKTSIPPRCKLPPLVETVTRFKLSSCAWQVGNPVVLFTDLRLHVTKQNQSRTVSSLSLTSPFLQLSSKSTHCSSVKSSCWHQRHFLSPAAPRRWSSETLRIVGCSCDRTGSLCHTPSPPPLTLCQCTWGKKALWLHQRVARLSSN